jgi:hypothetical protein
MSDLASHQPLRNDHGPRLAAPTRCGYRGPVTLYIEDDLPGFHTGWRRFYVKIGRKYVRIRNGNGHDRRISLRLYERLLAETANCFNRNNI